MKKYLSLVLIAGLLSGFSACDWCGSSCSKDKETVAPAATTDDSAATADDSAATTDDAATAPVADDSDSDSE